MIVWKEAGVAAISIYGRNAEGRPLRPDMRNFARMPGHGMARLLEQQNAIVEPLLHNRKVREIVFVCDGKKAIWAAAQKMNFHPMALDPRLLPRR